MSHEHTAFPALHPLYEANKYIQGQHSPSLYYEMLNTGSQSAGLYGSWRKTNIKLREDMAYFPDISLLYEGDGHNLNFSFHLLDSISAGGNDISRYNSSLYQPGHIPPSPMPSDLQLCTFDDMLIACDGVDDGFDGTSCGWQGSLTEPPIAVDQCISIPNMNEMLSPPALSWLTPDGVRPPPVLRRPLVEQLEYKDFTTVTFPSRRNQSQGNLDSPRFACPFTMCCSKSFVRTCDLHRHIALLHLVAQPLYKCPNCSARFSRHESRDRHTQRNACGKRMRSQRRPLSHKALKDMDRLRNSDHPAIVDAREYLAKMSPR